MDLTGEYRIPATTERVWAALNDPETLKACIPGCTELTRESNAQFVATVVAKVGPISATFKGSVTLSDLDPPRAYTITGQGQGGAAGFAKGSARITLAPEGAETVLRYEAKADIGGKLASVGSRLVQGVAKKTADDFFGAFVARVRTETQSPPTATTPAPPSDGVPSATMPLAASPPGFLGRWLWVAAALAAGAAALLVLLALGR